MKHTLITTLGLALLAMFLTAPVTAATCGGHGKGCCAKEDMAWKKDAKFEAANLDSGAKLTVTAGKPEAVKAIQEHFDKMAKGGCKHHGEEMKAEGHKCPGMQKEQAKVEAKEGAKEEAMEKDCCAWMKNAKFDVAKLDNGVKVTVTTDKKDDVKAIQEHAAMMGKGGCKHHQEQQGKPGDAGGHKGCPMHSKS